MAPGASEERVMVYNMVITTHFLPEHLQLRCINRTLENPYRGG
jgi:hypothetical protein